MVRLVGIVIIGLVSAACGYSATFHDCEVSCAADGSCPNGLACGEQRQCRVAGAVGACGATPSDAQNVDATRSDAKHDGVVSASDGAIPFTMSETTSDTVTAGIVDYCVGNGGTQTIDNDWFRAFELLVLRSHRSLPGHACPLHRRGGAR